MPCRSRIVAPAFATLIIAVASACRDARPAGEEERFTLEDGREAIGRRRIMERGTLEGWTPASDVRWGERWLVGRCEEDGSPDSVALHADPAMSRVSGWVVASSESGYCPGEPVMVVANTRLDARRDAIRVELLNGGRIGWLPSDALERRMSPEECAPMYAADEERRVRCEYGPPNWPLDPGEVADPS